MNTNGTARTNWTELLHPLPQGWRLLRLKNAAEITNSNVDKNSSKDETPVRLCNYTDVYYREFITNGLDLMPATATDSEIERFILRPGDVIITKDSETWSDIAIPAVVAEKLESVVCGYHLTILRPHAGLMEGRFLLRSLQAGGVREQFHVSAKGITRYGLSQHHIQDVLVPVPPVEEQRRLAAYLDRKTAKIDALIQNKQALIDLLREQRTALINRAVTKGLNPDVPMKDSGIEWVGEVPEHWEVTKIKWLSSVSRGASPRPIDDPTYFDADGEYAWVRIGDVTASARYLERTTQSLSELGASRSVKIEPGGLFLSIAGSVGKPVITKIKCCIHDGFVYFPRLSINPEFLYYIFLTGEPYKGLGKWGTQLNLNTDTVGDIPVPFPPAEEINAIIDHLDAKTREVDALIRREERAIVLMQELRASLISEVVTGKIDVRNSGGAADESPGEDIAA